MPQPNVTATSFHPRHAAPADSTLRPVGLQAERIAGLLRIRVAIAGADLHDQLATANVLRIPHDEAIELRDLTPGLRTTSSCAPMFSVTITAAAQTLNAVRRSTIGAS